MNIQHLEIVFSFDMIQKHLLTILLSSLYEQKQKREADIHLPTQSTRVSAPMEVQQAIKEKSYSQSVTQGMNVIPSHVNSMNDWSYWDEPPLSKEEETLLHFIQHEGMKGSEGVKYDEIMKEGMKMKWNENKIEYLGIERNNRIEELFVLYFKMVIFIIRLIVNILNQPIYSNESVCSNNNKDN